MSNVALVTVTARGDLDVSSAMTLRTRIARRLRERPCHLVLDLSGVSFIDCAGVSALVWARRRAEAQGVPFALAQPSDCVRQLLAATARDFTITDDEGARAEEETVRSLMHPQMRRHIPAANQVRWV